MSFHISECTFSKFQNFLSMVLLKKFHRFNPKNSLFLLFRPEFGTSLISDERVRKLLLKFY